VPLIVEPPDRSRFATCRADLEEVDAAQLAAAAGALSLLPANGHRLWRLGALATLAAERLSEGRPVAQTQLRNLLGAGDLAAMADIQEDPYEDVLTEELIFTGGVYLVGSGLAQDAVYVLRLLTRSLLLRPVLPDGLQAELTSICVAGLRLSDTVLRGAGLARHEEPARPPERGCEVPGATRLRRLMDLCTFDTAALAALGIAPAVLDPLVLQAGEHEFSDEEIAEGYADRWPLTRAAGSIVLSRPLGLALALRHHIVRRAADEVGSERVAQAFSDEVQEDVLRSLQRMGVPATEVRRRDPAQPWSELDAELDTDLRLVCAVIPDSFQGLSPDPYGTFATRGVIEQVQRRLDERAGEEPEMTLGLMVVQPAGRTAFFGMREPDVTELILEHINAADLEVLAFLEQDDRLALWKFARAHAALLSSARVNSFSTLDTYHAWLAEERSFTPLAGATWITVPPGPGGELRRRAKRGRDRHGALYVDGSVREVERERDEEFGDRIYHLTDIAEPQLILHVAGAPLDLWVSGPEGVDMVRASWDLVQTVAYWLGELVAPLQDKLTELAEQTPCLRIDVDVADAAFWFEGGPDLEAEVDDQVTIDGRTARLILGPALRRAALAPDNAGERALVARLLDALDGLASSMGLEPLASSRRDAVVEEVAPLGLKKHLLLLPLEGNALLADAEGPARLVQEADVTAARELLGRHLVRRFSLEVGDVPSDLRDRVADEAVQFLLGEVREVMDGTRPDDLLEHLLAANERIVAAGEQRRAMLPARAATYPAAADRKRLREQLASSAQAAVTCRFLVEYVAAQPPDGDKRWGLARYDRAMALAAEMLDWAHLNDALHYGMSDVGLLINSDGQLRLQELDRYQHGRSQYFDVHVAEQRTRAEEIFRLRFKTSDEADPSEIRARVDPLMAQESGATLTELGELLHAAASLAREAEVDVMVMDRAAVLDALRAELRWDATKVEQAVRYLSMGARDDFLNPPGGSWRDVVPSRFARRFSLNRRPLLERNGELLWGQRQPLAALQVIVGQIFSGRFQALAETDELRAELGRLAEGAGHAFEHEVAEIFDASPRFTVRENVESLAGVSLRRGNARDLGDIDVLAADEVTRILYGIECKDLAGALTPTEVAGELSEHFDAQEGGSTWKHAQRIAWLETHRAEALRELALNGPPDRWQVKGMFVTGQRVMAPYIQDVRFPIVAADDLAGWIERLPQPSARRERERKARRS
jgi:hypothetical protein